MPNLSRGNKNKMTTPSLPPFNDTITRNLEKRQRFKAARGGNMLAFIHTLLPGQFPCKAMARKKKEGNKLNYRQHLQKVSLGEAGWGGGGYMTHGVTPLCSSMAWL